MLDHWEIIETKIFSSAFLFSNANIEHNQIVSKAGYKSVALQATSAFIYVLYPNKPIEANS